MSHRGRSFGPAQPESINPAGDAIVNLQLTKATLRANGTSDALLGKIGATALRYFRAVAEPFKHRTCEAFCDLRWRLPSGAGHGDAHLEQFVVTDEDFGLAEFDNAGHGPAIVDLVRYAASLHLACREIERGCDRERTVTAYFDAYRAALDHPVRRSAGELLYDSAPELDRGRPRQRARTDDAHPHRRPDR